MEERVETRSGTSAFNANLLSRFDRLSLSVMYLGGRFKSIFMRPILLASVALIISFFSVAQNVGIGIAAPQFRLHVYQNSDVWHMSVGGASGALLIGGQTANGAVIQCYNPGTAVVRDLYLQRDGGNVGIATITPLAKLHVNGRTLFETNSDISNPGLLLRELDNDYARLTFSNNNGKSFTLAAYSDAGGTNDLLNFYSERQGRDLVAITGDQQYSLKAYAGASVNGGAGLLLQSQLRIPPRAFDRSLLTTADISVVNNLDVGNATIQYVNSYSTGRTTDITGMAGGVDGRILIVINDAVGGDVYLKDNDNRSSPENRFMFFNLGGQQKLGPFQSVMLFYKAGWGWIKITNVAN
jgi:hypothetical protein